MEEDKVKELAESLRKNGLVASMEEAIETARRILGSSKKGKEAQTTMDKDSPDYDITKEKKTLKELTEDD